MNKNNYLNFLCGFLVILRKIHINVPFCTGFHRDSLLLTRVILTILRAVDFEPILDRRRGADRVTAIVTCSNERGVASLFSVEHTQGGGCVL